MDVVYVPREQPFFNSLGGDGDRYLRWKNEHDRLVIGLNGEEQLFRVGTIVMEVLLSDALYVDTVSHKYEFPRNGAPIQVRARREWIYGGNDWYIGAVAKGKNAK